MTTIFKIGIAIIVLIFFIFNLMLFLGIYILQKVSLLLMYLMGGGDLMIRLLWFFQSSSTILSRSPFCRLCWL